MWIFITFSSSGSKWKGRPGLGKETYLKVIRSNENNLYTLKDANVIKVAKVVNYLLK